MTWQVSVTSEEICVTKFISEDEQCFVAFWSVCRLAMIHLVEAHCIILKIIQWIQVLLVYLSY